MLAEPCDAFAEQSSFIDYLLGVAGLARMVRALGTEAGPAPAPPDDLVYLLLGVARIGTAIEGIAEDVAVECHSAAGSGESGTRWLR